MDCPSAAGCGYSSQELFTLVNKSSSTCSSHLHLWPISPEHLLRAPLLTTTEVVETAVHPTILLGMHLCGFLSIHAIQCYKMIPGIQVIALAPCCLPSKDDPRSPRALLHTFKHLHVFFSGHRPYVAAPGRTQCPSGTAWPGCLSVCPSRRFPCQQWITDQGIIS